MKLIIGCTRKENAAWPRRRYRDGEFILQFWLDLTEGEISLVDRFGLGEHSIIINDANSGEDHDYTMGDLTGGVTFTVAGPVEVIHYKESFKKACQELVPILDLYGQRDSYEYEEEIDYPTNVQL